jgi:hypothetical protein
MTIDEFLARIAAQPPITHERLVYVWGPELEAMFASRLAAGKSMLLSELRAHPDQTQELRRFRYGHVVGPGLAPAEVEAWQCKWRDARLPADVVHLLTRVNGIHLWAELDRSRAYFGILPLIEWQAVIHSDLAESYGLPPEGHFMISYHDNGDYFLILDAHNSRYLWWDVQNFGVHPKQVATTVEELLDWWWNHAAELDPRREKAVLDHDDD